MAGKKRRRRIAGPVARRWFAVGALALVALLYYRPLHDYLQARSQRAVRVAAVHKLQKQQFSLLRRLQRAWSLRTAPPRPPPGAVPACRSGRGRTQAAKAAVLAPASAPPSLVAAHHRAG